MDDKNNKKQFSRSFQSNTQKQISDKQNTLNPAEKLQQFQQEIHQDRADMKQKEDDQKFEPTTLIKKNFMEKMQDAVGKALGQKKTTKNDSGETVQKDKSGPNRPTDFEGMTIQDIIAPIDIEVDFNHVQIGDTYYQTLFVSGYPRFVGPNWLSPIINFEHSLRISSFYYPVDSKVILEKLKKKIGEMEATLYAQMEGRKVVDPSLKVALTDAQKLQDSIAEGTEKYFHFGMYITVSAKDLKTLEKISRNAISTLAAINVTANSATLQQEQGLISTQPLGLDKIYITRNMDTTSLATTFPFVTSELTMDHGIMYGINQHNRSLVIFDRFEMENANTVVFAKSGAGKSYFVKLEAIRSLMLGTEILIIDPDREYQDLSDAVGGTYISFSQNKGDKMNPFELSGVGDEGDDELRMKLLSLQGFFKILFGGLNNIEMSILDRALLLTYHEKGITLDPKTQRSNKPPMLEDLYKVLKGMAEPEARAMSRRLERYILGSGAGIFNEASTVEINNQLTVFSIRDLQEELRPMAMYLMLDYIWTKIRKDKKKRLLIVDEAWYMMGNPDSAKFMYSMAKRARKYYLGLTTITQDVEDFLNNDMGRAIITNSSIQMLMKQSPPSVEKLQKVFNLSEGEKSYLLNADVGQGLFFAGANHVAIQVIASQAEHELITSNPQEIEERESKEKDKERSIQELAMIFDPPAVQKPLKQGVDTNERNVIQKAISRRKSDVEQMMQEKMQYKQESMQQGLTDQVVAQRKKLQGNQTHITPQGIIDNLDDKKNGNANNQRTGR